MQKGDTIRARFMTLPSEYPGSGANDEKRFPVRKGTVVYAHPKGRYIVAGCGRRSSRRTWRHKKRGHLYGALF